MYSLTLSACTSPAGRADSLRLTEVGGGGKWNLATTPPGLLQSELQGWPRRPVLRLMSAAEAAESGCSRRPEGLIRLPESPQERQAGCRWLGGRAEPTPVG